MRAAFAGHICFILIALLMAGCANVVPPSGGPKDETPPKLRSIAPPDSGLHTRVREIELQFDEYVTLTDAPAQVQISPLLSVPLTVTSLNKRVKVTIPDSLLLDETTYRITFGTAIRDITEGNIYESAGYTFSTGSYFDSLAISGTVHDAMTGLPDSAALVMLYSALESDSAVVRHKPLYVTHADFSGNFLFRGLPPRAFRIYALRDANGNLTFDGGKEWIAFADSVIRPAAGQITHIPLRSFPESPGDSISTDTGAAAATQARVAAVLGTRPALRGAGIPAGSYRVNADTSDARRRSQDITEPLSISLGRRLSGSMNPARIFLSLDSAGITVEAPVRIVPDSTGLQYKLHTPWREDAVYTLRLQKGFAVDSAGAELLPGRFTFRTRRDEDYGKLRIHLPTQLYGRQYILQVMNGPDTVYQQPVLDSNVALLRIEPGTYSMRVIVDSNLNGRWDAGDLFRRRQPERVIPYDNSIQLKAGWEQQVDFELPAARKPDMNADTGAGAGPPKR